MIKRVLQSVSVTEQSLLSVGPSENWPELCTSEWVHIFIGKTNGGRKKGDWKGVTCRDHIKVNVITFRSPIKQPTFGDATTGFPANDVWATSPEIPYWWSVTSQIWVVPLVGRAAWEVCFNQSEALPRCAITFQTLDIFYARMAQFTCMFVIEPILSTDLTDFFAVVV